MSHPDTEKSHRQPFGTMQREVHSRSPLRIINVKPLVPRDIRLLSLTRTKPTFTP
jgi:hypothetical protein